MEKLIILLRNVKGVYKFLCTLIFRSKLLLHLEKGIKKFSRIFISKKTCEKNAFRKFWEKLTKIGINGL